MSYPIYTGSKLMQFYYCLRERLLNNLDYLTDVRLDFEQHLNQDGSLPFNSPIIFIDFPVIDYKSVGYPVQTCYLEFNIRICLENYDKDVTKIYNIKEDVNRFINNYNSSYFGFMKKIEENRSKESNDSLFIHDILFTTSYYENNVYSEDVTKVDMLSLEKFTDIYGGTDAAGTNAFYLDIDQKYK